MARALTDAWAGHDAEAFRPLLPFKGAPWADMAAGLNLALGFCGAASLVHDGWADGQGSTTAEIWAPHLKYDIPAAPSPRHDKIRVTVWGNSPEDTGQVRVRETTAGVWQVFEMPVVAGAVTHEVTSAAFAAPGVLEIQATGAVNLHSVDAEVVAWTPAEWPGGGEHPEGPVVSPEIVPVELEEFDDDRGVGARLVTDMRLAVEHARTRPVVYFNAASPRLGVGDASGSGIRARPLRAEAPVPFEGTTLTVRIRAEGGEEDGEIWIQHGRGGVAAVVDGRALPDKVRIPVAADAPEQLYEVTRLFRASRQVDVPSRYPGFSHLAVYASPQVTLWSVAAWGQ